MTEHVYIAREWFLGSMRTGHPQSASQVSEQHPVYTSSYCGLRTRPLMVRRSEPWPISLIHGPRPKWTLAVRCHTVAPLDPFTTPRDESRSQRGSNLPKKSSRCILGGYSGPLMRFSKGALLQTFWFCRHYYLSVHKPRRAC